MLLGLVPLARAQSSSRPIVEIGVVLDGPGSLREDLRMQLEAELNALTSREFDVRFPADRELRGDGAVAAARRALNALYLDRGVEIVIAAEPISSQAVLDQAREVGRLTKPTIAPVVLDVGLQSAPVEGTSSGVENLSYIAFPMDYSADMVALQQVVAYEHLGVVVDADP